MRIRLQGVTLYLGRRRKDGYRNLERVRFHDWNRITPLLRRSRYRSRLEGDRLLIQPDDPSQLLLPFVQA